MTAFRCLNSEAIAISHMFRTNFSFSFSLCHAIHTNDSRDNGTISQVLLLFFQLVTILVLKFQFHHLENVSQTKKDKLSACSGLCFEAFYVNI